MKNGTIAIALVLIVAFGCSQQGTNQSNDSSPKVTPVAFNTSGAPTVEFSVPDMMCPEGCGARVKEILSKQPGAKDVLVDFPNKTATVAIDKNTFNPKDAIAALVDKQFKHAALKNESAPEAVTPSVK